MKAIKKISIVYLFLAFFSFPVVSQTLNPDSLMQRAEDFGHFLLYRNHDTTYITSYAHKLTTKLLAISKINFFRIRDRGNGSNVRFRPDRGVNLGVGLSYKWFALDLAFNFGIGEDSGFKNRKAFDFQGAIFSSKQYISGSIQYYYGYQYDSFNGVPKEDVPENKTRDDVRSVSTVIQYLFAYSYDKFSLKAPFIQNEQQLKSAGSFLIGGRFQLYSVDADSSMVPVSAQGYFDEQAHLTNLTGASLVVNFGYMYTFVFNKHFYATLGLIPGLGLNLGDFKSDYKEPFLTHLTTGINLMSAVGYNSPRFFGGIQLVGDTYWYRLADELRLSQGQGKFKLNFGYRFGHKN